VSKVGFVTMGESAGGEDIPTIGVGMLGYGFMGKAHSNAYKTLAYMTWPPPLMPQLVAIAGRNEEAVAGAARRYGFADHVTDWKKLVTDPRIAVFDNSGPNNFHAEPTIAAAEAGKHVICEKPLGRTADEAFETWQRVAATGVKAMCAFNYRFVPAVRLAQQIIASGELGEIFHFRGRYLQEWIIDADFPMVWRLDKDVAGSGALGDLGAHVIDLARYLVGEISLVSASLRTFVEGREVDDAFEAVVEFDGQALGTIEATRFAAGRKNAFSWEINADVSIGPVGLGATIAGMVNESITMFSGTSETDTYTAPVVDQIQVCTLWQLYFDYVITDVDANPIVYSGEFSRPSWQGRTATLGGSDPNTTNTLTFPTNQVYFSVVSVAS